MPLPECGKQCDDIMPSLGHNNGTGQTDGLNYCNNSIALCMDLMQTRGNFFENSNIVTYAHTVCHRGIGKMRDCSIKSQHLPNRIRNPNYITDSRNFFIPFYP